ncbi:hypothetical protein N9N67_08695, partial [Bacteriovoracaceae bacterium]|nr:hypothetical protein [Bacteriovoracaceae bacterium]
MKTFFFFTLFFMFHSLFADPLPQATFTIEGLNNPESVLIMGNKLFVTDMGEDPRSKFKYDGKIKLFS